MEENEISLGKATLTVHPEIVGLDEAMRDADALIAKLNAALTIMQRIGSAAISVEINPDGLEPENRS